MSFWMCGRLLMLFAAVTLKNWYTHKEYVNYYSDDFTKKT